MLRAPNLLVSALLTGLLAGQNSWTVTAGNPANLQNAVNSAAAGDEILVHPGTYTGLSVNRSVTIRALQPGTVTVQNVTFYSLFFIPLGQSAHVIGLNFEDVGCSGQGTTRFEDCAFAAAGIALNVAFGTVHLERCVLEGLPHWTNAPVVVLGQGAMTAVDSEIRALSGGGASPALDIQDATFVGTDLELVGNGTSAINSQMNAVIRLSDSVVTGGGAACAITGGDARCDRCTLSNTCGVQQGTMLGMWADTALAVGQTYTLNLRGEPNAIVLVIGGNDIGYTSAPEINLPFLLAVGSSFPAAVLLLDTSGQAAVSWQLPSVTLPPATGLWFQGVSGASFPLSASTLVGGMVR